VEVATGGDQGAAARPGGRSSSNSTSCRSGSISSGWVTASRSASVSGVSWRLRPVGSARPDAHPRDARRRTAATSGGDPVRSGSARPPPSRTGRARTRWGARRWRRAPPRRPCPAPRGCPGPRRRGCGRCGTRGTAGRRRSARRSASGSDRARSAGSAPGGRAATATSTSCLRSHSYTRSAAAWPAASGSKASTSRGANRCRVRTCSSVRAVPQVATARSSPTVGEPDHVGVALADDDLVGPARPRPWPS
jgi:hypothetical protein